MACIKICPKHLSAQKEGSPKAFLFQGAPDAHEPIRAKVPVNLSRSQEIMPTPVQAVCFERPEVAFPLGSPGFASASWPSHTCDGITDVRKLPVSWPMDLRHRLQEHRKRTSSYTSISASRKHKHPKNYITYPLRLRSKCLTAAVLIRMGVVKAEVDFHTRRRWYPGWKNRSPWRSQCQLEPTKIECLCTAQIVVPLA